MRKFSWMLLVLLVVGCGEEIADDEDKAVKDLVKDEVVAEADPEKEIVWEKDGKGMVLIPAGSFEMGDHFNEGIDDGRELPVHTVELYGFYMDVNEVTVGQFREFVNQSGYNYKGDWGNVAKQSPGDNYPMIYVDWSDAVAYCRWAGKRLPTEAEWEYAARGGRVGKRYLWGDGENVARDHANYRGTGGKDTWGQTAPVGSLEANGYKLYDMAGNVDEWCADWYGEDYYSKSPAKNPRRTRKGSHRVLRGGAWNFPTSALRVAYRDSGRPDSTYYNSGFRCVANVP